jgi:hypothetical protein
MSLIDGVIFRRGITKLNCLNPTAKYGQPLLTPDRASGCESMGVASKLRSISNSTQWYDRVWSSIKGNMGGLCHWKRMK